jgi:hypothetical protein
MPYKTPQPKKQTVGNADYIGQRKRGPKGRINEWTGTRWKAVDTVNTSKSRDAAMAARGPKPSAKNVSTGYRAAATSPGGRPKVGELRRGPKGNMNRWNGSRWVYAGAGTKRPSSIPVRRRKP